MMRPEKLMILSLVAMLAVTACVDYEINPNTHYKTGVAAFNEFESALDNTFTPFDNALKMDTFIGYVGANTLGDKSNLLEVWLTAEDIFFPSYRVRNSGDSWCCIDGTDTLYMVETGGNRLSVPGSSWTYFEPRNISNGLISYGDDFVFVYCLDDYKVKIGTEYNYYTAVVDALLEIYPNGVLVADSLNANIYELSGNIGITTERYYTDSQSYYGGGLRKVTLTATIPGSTKLRHNIMPFNTGMYDQGGYNLEINDQTLGLSEDVEISIVPLPTYYRTVTVIYRGDTVIIDQ